jgi:hypothetical protein
VYGFPPSIHPVLTRTSLALGNKGKLMSSLAEPKPPTRKINDSHALCNSHLPRIRRRDKQRGKR